MRLRLLALLALASLALSALPAVAQPGADQELSATPLQASAAPAAEEYRRGEPIAVQGVVQDAATGEPAPARVIARLVDPDGQVLADEVEAVAGPDGSYSVAFPAEATAGLEIGADTGYHLVLAAVIEAVPLDAPDGTRGEVLSTEAVVLAAPPDGLVLENSFVSSVGWVKPGQTYPSRLVLTNHGPDPVAGALVVVPPTEGMAFIAARPLGEDAGTAEVRSDGSVRWSVGTVPGGAVAEPTRVELVLEASAATLAEDPRIVWKDLSTEATLTTADATATARSHGPKVIPPNGTYDSARYGDRPFPVVPVDFRDFAHHPDNSGGDLAAIINDPDLEGSTFNLFQEMSYGQLFPEGTVPSAGIATAGWDDVDPAAFHTPDPDPKDPEHCLGEFDTAVLPDARIVNGFYQLPGELEYYGSDSGASGDATVDPDGDIDDACGSISKVVYDAAAIADPEIDYNEFDTDKDGVVDFFMMVFAGCGGNGVSQANCFDSAYGEEPGENGGDGYDAIWPHSSTLLNSFRDPATGVTGYISDDQLTDLEGNPLYYTDVTRVEFTTEDTGIPAYVRVGPYNVNPEDSLEAASVISHEYGHSLGLPDYYGAVFASFYGTWNLMAADYSQHMDLNGRQELGWVIPREVPADAEDLTLQMQDGKNDTHRIEWRTPDGQPYALEGPDVHNGDAYVVPLPRRQIIDPAIVEEGASPSHVWWSRSGNDFGCPPEPSGHSLDIPLDVLGDLDPGTEVTLELRSYWDIEWDFDYGFVLLTTDGSSYTSLPSQEGYTFPAEDNPHDVICQEQLGNGLTGTSGAWEDGDITEERAAGEQAPGQRFLPMTFDLTDVAGADGDDIAIRFAYVTDVGFARPGWFIDDVRVVTGDGQALYTNDFEASSGDGVVNGGCDDGLRTGPCTDGWQWVEGGEISAADHAYYFELRDRSGFDLDANGQADREPGHPTWTPGLSLVYTDEARGTGNSFEASRPNQTVLDANPHDDPIPIEEIETFGDLLPWLDPDLDDAAWTPDSEPFSDFGDGHVDNYVDFDREDWHFRLDHQCLELDVLSMAGVEPLGPEAPPGDLVAEVQVTRGDGCGERDDGAGNLEDHPPVAVAQAKQRVVQLGDPVEVDASASRDDLTPLSRLEVAWDFDGDGEADATTEQAAWTYESVGIHTITLTVTDEAGQSTTDTIAVRVQADPVGPPPGPGPGPEPPGPDPEPPLPPDDSGCERVDDGIRCGDVHFTGEGLQALRLDAAGDLPNLGDLLALVFATVADGPVTITVTVEGDRRTCLVAFDDDGSDRLATCTDPDDPAFAQDTPTHELSLTLDRSSRLGVVAVDEGTLRLAGDTRITTAIAAARSGWTTADTVLLASAGSFADALSAAPLAGAHDAPLLLTDGAALSEEVVEELQRLGAAEVIVLGGSAAVGQAVEDALAAMGLAVTRIGGDDRTETAELIAGAVGADHGHAVIAAGGSFADPLAVAPVAAQRELPVYLATDAGLTDATLAALARDGITEAVLVGGTAVLPDDVERQLADAGIAVADRLAGPERYATAVAVLQWAVASGADPTELLVATGADFPDALTAGALGGRLDRPVLLVDGRGTFTGSPAADWLAANAGEVELGVLLGGDAAISDDVRQALTAALG